MNSVLLSSACWPNLQYFDHLLNSETALIEQHDTYTKQTFRNRYEILTANGVLSLTVPVKHLSSRMKMAEVPISYSERWQIRHWRAITSAYKNSPFFEFFEDEISAFYKQKTELLLQYNMAQLETIFKLLRVRKKTALTESFERNFTGDLDLRSSIHPKIALAEDKETESRLSKPYYQTFGERHGFVSNLSILDGLFNKGTGIGDYLLA